MRTVQNQAFCGVLAAAFLVGCAGEFHQPSTSATENLYSHAMNGRVLMSLRTIAQSNAGEDKPEIARKNFASVEAVANSLGASIAGEPGLARYSGVDLLSDRAGSAEALPDDIDSMCS